MLRTRIRAGTVAGVVLSLVFAVALCAVQSFELFIDAWTPQLGETTVVTLRVPYGPRIVRNMYSGGSNLSYEHTRIIIPAGTLLSEQNQDHRAAVAYDSIRRPPRGTRLLAYAVIDFTLGMLLTAYLRRFGQNRVRLLRTQIGLFVAMLLMSVVVKVMLLFTGLPEFWVPVAALPLWVSLAFDRRTAFLVSLVLAFVASSFLRFDLMLLTVVLVRGMAASLLFLDRKHPRQMVPAGALAGLFACGLFAAISVVFEGSFDVANDLSQPGHSMLVANFGGGVVAGALALLLRDAAERLLGAVSRDKLLDLTDLEQPLLQKMAREAPGSWEHARAMANLAEAAASAVGADALLVRAGAYFHDLGKTVQPKYFVENLSPGEESPHEDLEPEVSADAIMAHVVSGAKILREGGIPEPVVEFAYTHHGTQVVEYFWHKCINAGNPKALTEEHFRYPGMKPQTKETAILMLVDSIEAASRTIEPPEREKFEEMIQRIIFTKLRGGQLDESGLTVADLRTLVTRMSDTLVNMFHHRIRYPWQDQRRVTTPGVVPSAPGVASISVRGTMSSAPPSVLERGTPSVPAESGSMAPRDREPPPSIIVGPPLSLVPSPASVPPSQESAPSTAPSFPQKKS
ncbi:MAG TPA: HDIG domain-containing protein [Polyangiaceae bacterium]|nr:HDIG domain-containing protein [Polyangiaceae bacterium]